MSDYSVFWLMISAHDKLARNREWPLEVRKTACALIWLCVIEVPIGARFDWGAPVPDKLRLEVIR